MTDRRILRMKDLVEICGISESTIYREIKAKRFPPKCKNPISLRSVGWSSIDIAGWMDGKRDWS